ncbi:5-amino-6-(D-ribitylamino)uracil--L-tyrosine 4-hydroxyphenyl transferase CofH [Rhodoligotrophos defluvii]|uniref:5-amino-6-(D-ribitylamino)uracil--L-tyrosine 4-hydroxyphenyl transferase CofH n=1 Tax=Rhodoligotrophos defluvii TaxID=2561934 RepID=UPI0010C9C7A1|nr:5-amino-6-(D-ribitylamino)uracil--L-tyrosine 4-hydroxyphenyl transferase CofH [Rhodoligotrophos defluvii]
MTDDIAGFGRLWAADRLPSPEDALRLADVSDTAELMRLAARLRDDGHGDIVSYSRKVFIPLTQLCRDTCHYCTFAKAPRRIEAPYLLPESVLAIARAGARAGCHEALFTLGDKPELRYRVAREALAALGHDTTLSYLAEMARLVLEETGLLPHLNPGVLSPTEIADLRKVSVSQGIMLETSADRLSARGGPHFGSPDKHPTVRLATIAAAGEAQVPFTSGILIGIGETRRERIEALLALRDLHQRHGHLQEIIVQNFRAKPGTRMAAAPEPSFEDHLWTIAVARILFGPAMNIQAPPNLSAGALEQQIAAGINDWGGVSPVTPDHVNPEAPWPEIERLAQATAAAGKVLTERLAIYPQYVRDAARWLDPAITTPTLRQADAEGFARACRWMPGAPARRPVEMREHMRATPIGIGSPPRTALADTLAKAVAGDDLTEAEIVLLFAARGADAERVYQAADDLRRAQVGDIVRYVVNRNINYTNVCSYRCQFCAFSKGKLSENLRGRPYDLDHDEICRRSREAWDRGATEVCLQGGIHPDYTGETYLGILRALKAATPDIHIHAFSPLEIWQGAATLGLSVRDFLTALKTEGLGTLPGTAAEILDDEVRRIICPDKLTTAQWLEVVETAHAVGLSTTATIMFGHVDHPRHWARHLIHIRNLQKRTGGFTEFVPLPFVPMETPIYLKGRARSGPTLREALLMHAVARLTLHPHIRNIQTSWVKMGEEGAKLCLQAGANDLGGTLMNETISKAAGASHGQEMAPARMERLITAIGRIPQQRTTLYGPVPPERREASFAAAPLTAPVATPAAQKYHRERRPAALAPMSSTIAD